LSAAVNKCLLSSRFYGQLSPHTSKSKVKRYSDLANSFCGTPVDLSDLTMHKKCFAVRNHSAIIKATITKADRNSAVVILNKSNYIAKMDAILKDNSKFCEIDLVETKDNTTTIEEIIQRRFLELKKGNVLAEPIYKTIRHSGSQIPKPQDVPK